MACAFVFICTCTFLRRVRIVRPMIIEKRFGPLSIFQKASIIGIRLDYQIATLCVLLSIYILLKSK